MTDRILHVYGPGVWHDLVIIAGTRDALLALAAALREAVMLPGGEGALRTETQGFVTTDGEGFAVEIRAESPLGMKRYVLPYTDAMAQDQNESTSTDWPLKENFDA